MCRKTLPLFLLKKKDKLQMHRKNCIVVTANLDYYLFLQFKVIFFITDFTN